MPLAGGLDASRNRDRGRRTGLPARHDQIWLVTRNLARTDNVRMEAWYTVNSADCEMMAVVGFGIAIGCAVMLVIFWRVLPWLIRQ